MSTDLETQWAHEDEIQSYRIALAERSRAVRALEERLAEREAEIRRLRARLSEVMAAGFDTATGALSGGTAQGQTDGHGGTQCWPKEEQ